MSGAPSSPSVDTDGEQKEGATGGGVVHVDVDTLVRDGESDGTVEESQAMSAAVPWSKGLDGTPEMALRKRPGRVVKLVPVVEDTKGMERSKDGSIILRDETMLRDRIYACSPRLGKCIDTIKVLNMALFLLFFLVVLPALPFAILKFTNTTDVLFGQHVVNASSAAASAVNISNIASDHNGPPWWVDVNVNVNVCVRVGDYWREREWARDES